MFNSLRRRKSEKKAQLTSSTSSLSSSRSEDELVSSSTKSIKKSNGSKRSLFISGIAVGIFLAVASMTPLPEHAATLMEQHFPHLEKEWREFRNSIPEPWKLNNDGREFKVGEALAKRGLTAEYPVILIPGIVSTALESWSTAPEYRASFREKLWGGFHMVSQATLNRDRWIAAIMLDPVTGLDPPNGAKLRAVAGIDAASSFVQGYWIWQKVIENLAVLNYDSNNLELASYDWRLSYWNLEERDGYFRRLMGSIENFKRRQGKKTVLVAHSMGVTVALYFFKWVEASGPCFGNGGPQWVEDHVEALITIGGTFLGVPKAMTAFLSGETRDTVAISPTGAYVLERFFSRKERAKLFWSWAGSASMWIKGGDSVWGNATYAPDDLPEAVYSHGQLLSFRHKHGEDRNLTASAAGDWILEHTPISFQKMLESNFSNGIERDEEALKRNDGDHRKWSNPLESRLPNAPSLKIYCVYGYGKETERSYWYARGAFERDETEADEPNAVCPSNSTDCAQTVLPPLDMPLSRASWIDTEFHHGDIKPKTLNGVKIGEGDGTVSLISLGAMCAEGWTRRRWNPGGVKIITHELPHQPSPTEPRGGANTSEHIDILGSTGLNEILLKVATGKGDEVGERFVSPIKEYAKRIRWDN